MTENKTCWRRVRHCLASLKSCFMCSCFNKILTRNNQENNVPGFGDQDAIIRLPAVFHNMEMITLGLVPVERWTSAPTYINIPPPPLVTPSDRPHKRRSSPGRIDWSIIEQIKEELQGTTKKIEGEEK